MCKLRSFRAEWPKKTPFFPQLFSLQGRSPLPLGEEPRLLSLLYGSFTVQPPPGMRSLPVLKMPSLSHKVLFGHEKKRQALRKWLLTIGLNTHIV